MEGKCLWATDAFTSNDSDELTHGINIAREIIQNLDSLFEKRQIHVDVKKFFDPKRAIFVVTTVCFKLFFYHKLTQG